MKNDKVLYIKTYPAELGGVSRLGEAVYKKLINVGKDIDVLEIDVSKNKIMNIGAGILLMLNKVAKYRKVFYSLDSKRTAFFLRMQSLFAKETLKKTIAIIPAYSGKQLLIDAPYFKHGILNEIQCVWVETESLKNEIFHLCKNVEVFPNARSIGQGVEPRLYQSGDVLHLLYYSLLSKDKGIYDTMEIVEELNRNGRVKFDIDFFGNYENDETKKIFSQFLNKNINAHYLGFNDSSNLVEYYKRINRYDIMLFMTHWISEGIPGVCVDAKASGVAIVANDHNMNSDVVLSGEGKIVEEGNIKAVVDTIEWLYNNPTVLNELKKGSYESRIRYEIDSYQRLYDKV